MHRTDYLALLISILAFFAAWQVTDQVFEQMAHIEDEMAYVWQAQAIAEGKLTVPSPPEPKAFLVPFVVDYQGQRFAKYPPGWSAALGIGVFLGIRSLINPLLAGLGVWLIYRLGQRLFNNLVGLLASALTLTSPFFLMNSGSLLSHPFGLFLSTAFALAWLDAWTDANPSRKALEAGLPVVVAAVCLGILVITRPLTALGVCLPFIFHGIYLFYRGDRRVRLRLVIFCLLVLILTSLLFLWQFAVTGNALLNPYTLWWKYDKIGFGPGFGVTENGHSWNLAKINTRHSLNVGWHDLFGWGQYSWIFLPFGVLTIFTKRNWRALMVGIVFPSLVLVYLFYWIGSSLFGPRYFYEGMYSLTLVSAAGIAYLASWPTRQGMVWQKFTGWRKSRPLLLTALLVILISTNLFYYLPARMDSMFGLYGVSRNRLAPFLTPSAQELTPALIVVHANKWIEYGTLLELQTPFLDTPFIFVIDTKKDLATSLKESFPDRNVIEYYPFTPYTFYVHR